MADLIGEAGGDLFQYNREGWKFGAEMRQRDLYQRQKMRIKQVDLYREDIRDLFDLTVGKMDKYVIVCLVMLSITMDLFYKGRNPVGTPSWLFWCWSICTAGSMLYLLMSIWLALHASISAQTFSVRCLTQWLRLPIPSPEEIIKGAALLEEYESAGTESLLRVPVFGKGTEKGTGLAGTNPAKTLQRDLTTDWQLFTSHFELFNKLHRNWQGYEAYARVCMCLGLNHFLAAMSYFSLAVYALELESPWTGWAFVIIFQSSALLHARLNLNLTASESMLMIALVIIPSLFLSIAVAITMTGSKFALEPTVFACVGILGQIAWIGFFLYQTKSDVNGLPVKFSSIWCIDVVGFGKETLREVQEPVGKSTYAEKLPGYSKTKAPSNNYNIGPGDGEMDLDPGDAAPEPAEIQKRSKLPWRLFTIGNFFTVILWLFALAQTVTIPFGIDTGTGSTSRRLSSLTKTEVEFPVLSVRGLIGDSVLADEWTLRNIFTGEKINCSLPSNTVIRTISGSIKNPFVLSRSTSGIWDCARNRFVESPIDGSEIFSMAIRNGEIFCLKSDGIHFLASDLKEPQWIPLPSSQTRTYHNGCSMGIHSEDDVLVVLDPDSQRIDRYDVSSGDFLDQRNLKHQHFHWTHTSGDALVGSVKGSNFKRIISSL